MSPRRSGRIVPCTTAECRSRRDQARTFLQVAQLVLTEDRREAHVAAALAVLAGHRRYLRAQPRQVEPPNDLISVSNALGASCVRPTLCARHVPEWWTHGSTERGHHLAGVNAARPRRYLSVGRSRTLLCPAEDWEFSRCQVGVLGRISVVRRSERPAISQETPP
jgi:hypothetical protein